MSYRIEAGKVIFQEAPREGAEVEVIVSKVNTLKGFSDPRGFYPRRVNEADTNRLAVNDQRNQHPVNKFKSDNVDDLTNEPKSSYNAQYPFNHVKETESGHIQEFDDTPGHERIHEYHRSGTFYEIHPDGTKVTKIVGDDFEIVHRNKQVRVRGNLKVFVDGDTDLYVRGSMNAQIDEHLKFNVGKNIDFHAGKNIRMFANESIEMTAQTTMTQQSVGKFLQQSTGDMQIITAANFTNAVLGNYDMVIDGNSHTDIKGNLSSSITGNVGMLAEGTFATTIKGASSFHTEATLDIASTGTTNLTSTGAMSIGTAAALTVYGGGATKLGSGAAINIDGATVGLNDGSATAVTVSEITAVIPIVPRIKPSPPAGDGYAPEVTFMDTGDIATGILPFSIDDEEYDTDGFSPKIEALKEAEVLEEKPFVPLTVSDEFFEGDDEEKSDAEIKSAIEEGKIMPTSFSDYSYNALTGKINTNGAARKATSIPRVPDEGEEHGEGGSDFSVEPEAAADTAAVEIAQADFKYDGAGDVLGGVNYSLPLSTHFTLGQLSKNSVVASSTIAKGGNEGKTQKEIIDKLKTLAVHVLDPIKEQYPDMIVTNAYRGKSGKSQHNIGEAADIQFPGVAKSEYYARAQWIRENVSHDQLILEYKNTGSGLPWIHISCKDAGNRLAIFTMYNHKKYKDNGKFYQLA